MENLKAKQETLINISQCTQLEESQVFWYSTQWFQLNSALGVTVSANHSSGAKNGICCVHSERDQKGISTPFYENEEWIFIPWDTDFYCR